MAFQQWGFWPTNIWQINSPKPWYCKKKIREAFKALLFVSFWLGTLTFNQQCLTCVEKEEKLIILTMLNERSSPFGVCRDAIDYRWTWFSRTRSVSKGSIVFSHKRLFCDWRTVYLHRYGSIRDRKLIVKQMKCWMIFCYVLRYSYWWILHIMVEIYI